MKHLLVIFAFLLLAVDLRGQGTIRTLLTTNASNPNQFGPGAIKSGALLTNINVKGTFVVNTNGLVVTNGMVGIGTASPAQMLEISSSTNPLVRFNHTNASGSRKITDLGYSGDFFVIRRMLDNGTTIASTITVDVDGNVIMPATLTVNGLSFTGVGNIISSGYFGFDVNHYIHPFSSGAGRGLLAMANDSFSVMGNVGGGINSNTIIGISGTTGFVGIGTNAPGAQLDVIGTNRANYFIGNGGGLTNLAALTNGNASIWLPLPSAKMPNTNFMTIDWATNYSPSLITTTNTSAFFTLPIPSNYVTNTLAIRCQYAMETGITNSFILGASVMAMNPNGSTDQTVDSFGSEITVTNTVPGTVGAQNAFTISLVGNTDGLQSGDLLHLKLRSSTTITNRVFIKGLQLRYTQQ